MVGEGVFRVADGASSRGVSDESHRRRVAVSDSNSKRSLLSSNGRDHSLLRATTHSEENKSPLPSSDTFLFVERNEDVIERRASSVLFQ